MCVQGGTEGVPNDFGASRDPNAELQQGEAGSEVAELMDCTQRSQGQPGLADGNGPYAPRGFAERKAVAVSSGMGGRRLVSVSLRNPRQALRAEGRRVASRMCS
jgi:hypothetical protein